MPPAHCYGHRARNRMAAGNRLVGNVPLKKSLPMLDILRDAKFYRQDAGSALVVADYFGRIISNRSPVRQYQCGDAMRPMT